MGFFTISKQFSFSASHQLRGLEPGHQCARLHGHNYEVVLELRSSQLNEVGFVHDYGDMKPFEDYIKKTLDHRHLNAVLPDDMNPTAENLARFLYSIAWDMFHDAAITVYVSETPKTWASYTES
jgi:6-pyruvoyltetrahydropterin/6-carboxytetrahydropterin synthase